jgi:hypothetical protein
VKGWRERVLALQWLAPVPGLAVGLLGLSGERLTFDLPVVGFTLLLDASGALILTVAALLWIIVSAALWRDGRPDHRFAVSWLLTMCGNIGVFIAGDLVSFYFFSARVSIPAYGLFAFSENAEQQRAGAVYMVFTILGEALLLLAFAMLATGEPNGSLRIADVMAALPASPWRKPAYWHHQSDPRLPAGTGRCGTAGTALPTGRIAGHPGDANRCALAPDVTHPRRSVSRLAPPGCTHRGPLQRN